MPYTKKMPSQGTVVGSRIRQLRKDKNLTQAELAGKVGIQQSDLCRIENGEYRVNLDTLFKILLVFKMSISEFFQDKPRETRDWERGLIEDFEKLTPGAKNEIREFMRFKQRQEKDLKD